MRRFIIVFLAVSCVPALAQLSTDQKVVDFQQLAALISKRYAFVEWKRDAFHYDALAIADWLNKVKTSKDDLEFFEICSQYIAALNDGHAAFLLPSDYEARLGLNADFYSGKLLIDSIDRKLLPESQFPFQIGDELASMDGSPALARVDSLKAFIGTGNASATRRFAAGALTDRVQALLPRAHEIGDSSNITVVRQNGAQETYTIPWQKSGTPYTFAGPTPTPKGTRGNAAESSGDEPDPGPAPYLAPIRARENFRSTLPKFVTGFGGIKPVFDLPAGFVQRLGAGRFDSLFTGVFIVNSQKIGFLRVPEMSYSTVDLAKEIAYFQANTDALVVDVMHNPGGYGCDAEDLASYLIRDGFHSLGDSLRATWDWVMAFQDTVLLAQEFGASDDEIQALQVMLDSAKEAFQEERGFTFPLAICGVHKQIPPLRDKAGNFLAYTKPVLVLTDNLTASAAELFAAIMQDNGRAKIFGTRTNGAGGAVYEYLIGYSMEAMVSLPQSILVRANPTVTTEFPPAPYIENLGVIPDRTVDYMTVDNLLSRGKPFVDAFSLAVLDLLAQGQ